MDRFRIWLEGIEDTDDIEFRGLLGFVASNCYFNRMCRDNNIKPGTLGRLDSNAPSRKMVELSKRMYIRHHGPIHKDLDTVMEGIARDIVSHIKGEASSGSAWSPLIDILMSRREGVFCIRESEEIRNIAGNAFGMGDMDVFRYLNSNRVDLEKGRMAQKHINDLMEFKGGREICANACTAGGSYADARYRIDAIMLNSLVDACTPEPADDRLRLVFTMESVENLCNIPSVPNREEHDLVVFGSMDGMKGRTTAECNFGTTILRTGDFDSAHMTLEVIDTLHHDIDSAKRFILGSERRCRVVIGGNVPSDVVERILREFETVDTYHLGNKPVLMERIRLYGTTDVVDESVRMTSLRLTMDACSGKGLDVPVSRCLEYVLERTEVTGNDRTL